MRIPRGVSVLLSMALLLTLSGAFWARHSAQPDTGIIKQTEWGPLSAADEDLIVRVRRAGLWEHPVGDELTKRATKARVREIGGFISNEHISLDGITLDLADRLGVELPNEPTEEQKGWIDQVANADRADIDATAVMLLRQAHGKILPMIAAERTGSRNELVRKFAEAGAVFVQRHINYLESTGLVDFEALPPVILPKTPSTKLGGLPIPTATAMIPIGAVLLVAIALVASTGRRQNRVIAAPAPTRSRRPEYPRQPETPPAYQSDDLRPVSRSEDIRPVSRSGEVPRGRRARDPYPEDRYDHRDDFRTPAGAPGREDFRTPVEAPGRAWSRY